MATSVISYHTNIIIVDSIDIYQLLWYACNMICYSTPLIWYNKWKPNHDKVSIFWCLSWIWTNTIQHLGIIVIFLIWMTKLKIYYLKYKIHKYDLSTIIMISILILYSKLNINTVIILLKLNIGVDWPFLFDIWLLVALIHY